MLSEPLRSLRIEPLAHHTSSHYYASLRLLHDTRATSSSTLGYLHCHSVELDLALLSFERFSPKVWHWLVIHRWTMDTLKCAFERWRLALGRHFDNNEDEKRQFVLLNELLNVIPSSIDSIRGQVKDELL